MTERKPFLGDLKVHPKLDKLLEEARFVVVTDEQLQEQRVSFAFGNAPLSLKITKESVRDASKSIRMITKA